MVCSDVWYDKTWWEAELPPLWMFRRDHSKHGWPYVFEAPDGSGLWIRDLKHYESPGWDFSLVPPELTHEQKKAFALTVSCASPVKPVDIFQVGFFSLGMRQHMEGLTHRYNAKRASIASRLTRLDLGELVGFTYPLTNPKKVGWSGYFSHDPWMLQMTLVSPLEVLGERSRTAEAVIESIRFKGSDFQLPTQP